MTSEHHSHSSEPPTEPLEQYSSQISPSMRQDRGPASQNFPAVPQGKQPRVPIPPFVAKDLEYSASRSETLDWYDRDILTGMTQFGPDHDGFVVIVTPQAVEELREGTSQYAPNEAFGNLMGKAYMDDKGMFTVISGVVYAHQLRAGPGHVELTSGEMGELRRLASRAHPTAEFVGWTHSHSSLSDYSPIDRKEQATWTESYNVGILTFMTVGAGEPWARAYRGPTSQPLPSQERSGLFKSLGQQSTLNTQIQQAQAYRKKYMPPPKREGLLLSNIVNIFSRDFLVLAMLWLIVSTVILSVGLFRVDNNVTALRSQMNGLTNATSAAKTSIASISFLWNCSVHEGTAPLKVKCDAPVGPAINGWIWDFGDGTTLMTSSVTHVYQAPGVYTLKLTITSTSGDQNVGTLTITVINPSIPAQPTATLRTG